MHELYHNKNRQFTFVWWCTSSNTTYMQLVSYFNEIVRVFEHLYEFRKLSTQTSKAAILTAVHFTSDDKSAHKPELNYVYLC